MFLATQFVVISTFFLALVFSQTAEVTVDLNGVSWSHVSPPETVIAKRSISGRALTNAQLLARGLGPRVPAQYERRMAARKIAARHFHPAPARPSGIPTTPQHKRQRGHIVVKGPDGVLGWVAEKLTKKFSMFTICTDQNDAATFSRPIRKTENFNIEVDNEDYPYFGAARGLDHPTLPPPTYASLTSVDECSGPATSTNNSVGLGAESNIWTINANTLELNATWTLDNTTQLPMTLFYDFTYQDLDMTVDLEAFNSYFTQENTTAVRLFFVPS